MMSIISTDNVIKDWVQKLIFAFLVSVCTIGSLIALGLYWETFLNAPPIEVISHNPIPLGVVCPGDILVIENQVLINDEVIVHYFVSVMDAESNFNYPGTQIAYTDFLHPHPSTFVHFLDWRVPELPPGIYARVFAVRKVSGDEDTVFIVNYFEIPKGCRNGTPSS